jgi:hypothetical protein
MHGTTCSRSSCAGWGQWHTYGSAPGGAACRGPESAKEQWVATLVSAVFMVLVGLSLPPLFTESAAAEMMAAVTHSAAQSWPGWGMIAWHVLFIMGLANLGMTVPAVCYRREAHWKERLALAIAMWPRGEVSAGVLVLSFSYGFGGPLRPIITVATLSLALNLLLTGVFILLVKHLGLRATVPLTTGTLYGWAPARSVAAGFSKRGTGSDNHCAQHERLR